MKIALFSDIHANLPALEAVLQDIDEKNPDSIYCLGDLVGYNVWPNEVIREIRKRKIPTIAGNYDFGIGRNVNECGCAYKTEEDKAMGAISISFTNQIMEEGERQYLRTLPAHIRVEFQLNEEKITLLLVHGSPRKINEYLFEDREEKSLLRIMKEAGADIMAFGHTHKPYHRVLVSESDERLLHAINIGSVGKPKDGNVDACYVMLEIKEGQSDVKVDDISVDFIRVKYDVDRAAKAVEQSPLPDQYAAMLRKAF